LSFPIAAGIVSNLKDAGWPHKRVLVRPTSSDTVMIRRKKDASNLYMGDVRELFPLKPWRTAGLANVSDPYRNFCCIVIENEMTDTCCQAHTQRQPDPSCAFSSREATVQERSYTRCLISKEFK
jgi:hypothetical protein